MRLVVARPHVWLSGPFQCVLNFQQKNLLPCLSGHLAIDPRCPGVSSSRGARRVLSKLSVNLNLFWSQHVVSSIVGRHRTWRYIPGAREPDQPVQEISLSEKSLGPANTDNPNDALAINLDLESRMVPHPIPVRPPTGRPAMPEGAQPGRARYFPSTDERSTSVVDGGGSSSGGAVDTHLIPDPDGLRRLVSRTPRVTNHSQSHGGLPPPVSSHSATIASAISTLAVPYWVCLTH